MIHKPYSPLKNLIPFVLVLLGSAQATNYYFKRSTGVDTNPGTDTLKPWSSTKAIKGKIFLVPGDSLLFRRGETFTNETLFIARNIKTQGTADKHIVIGAWGAGANRPILTSPNGRLIVLEKVSNIDIIDIALTGAKTGCIEMVDSLPSSIRVQNTELYGCGGGVYASGTNIQVIKNSIHDMKMVVNSKGAAGTSAADDDYGASGIGLSRINGCTVLENNLRNLKAPSYDYGYDGGGFELWGTVRNCDITRNQLRNSAGFMEAGGIAGDSVTDVNFHHNISLEGGAFFCLHVLAPKANFGISYRNISFDHNLSINLKKNPGFHLLVVGDTLKDTTKLRVRNNVFLSDSLESYVYQEGMPGSRRMPGTFRNNLLWCISRPEIANWLQSKTEKFGDPKFVLANWFKEDSLTNNLASYRPQATSPLVASALVLKDVPASYSYDFAWQPTVHNEAADIGALAYVPPAQKTQVSGTLQSLEPSVPRAIRVGNRIEVTADLTPGTVMQYRVVTLEGKTLAGPGVLAASEGAANWSIALPHRTGLCLLKLEGAGFTPRTIALPGLR